jgi:hypothetical protein
MRACNRLVALLAGSALSLALSSQTTMSRIAGPATTPCSPEPFVFDEAISLVVTAPAVRTMVVTSGPFAGPFVGLW